MGEACAEPSAPGVILYVALKAPVGVELAA